jgi:hypothetical protein
MQIFHLNSYEFQNQLEDKNCSQKDYLKLIKIIFQTSKMPMYQTMWEFMNNHRSEVMVGSNTEGIAKVIKDNGKYAYMMESSSIQYIIERNCKVTQIGGNLDTKVKS